MELTIKKSFLAMFYLLDTYYDNGYEGDLGGLLGSINTCLFDGEMPADVATFEDWKSCLDEICGDKCGILDANMTYTAIIKFLEFYSTEFGFNLQDVINDMKSHKIGNESVEEVWKQCFS